jgi:SAM-dependent methyltransferase
MAVVTCPVCGDRAEFREHQVPRYRYGAEGSEPVTYRECLACGSLVIARIPDELEDEYGPGYHVPAGPGGRLSPLRRRVRLLRWRHAVGGRGLGRVLAAVLPPPLEAFPDLLRLARAEPGSRILDVGAGTGEILARLRDAGYRDVTGVDPFLPGEEERAVGVRIIQAELETLARDGREGPFDVIMFNHSLEHVPDPEAALRAARALLAPGGRVLVRVPVADCLAWKRYGTAWVQIDAPRHLFIFSREGLSAVASRAGLKLEAIRDDSTEVQFLGSELYREGRPLDDLAGRYGWAARRRLRKEARRLNMRGEGDQAGFVFTASDGTS